MDCRLGTLRRLVYAMPLGIVLAVAASSAATAAYPPGSFPGAAPGGAFPSVVFSESVCAGGGVAAFRSGAASLTLTVPAGAFTECRQVSVYGVNASAVAALLPSGNALIDGFAVAWDPASPASSPLTLAVEDAAIPAVASVFGTTTSGLTKLAGVSVVAGTVSLSFSDRIGFVIAGPGAATPKPSNAVAGATATPVPVPAEPADNASSSGPPWALLALLGLLALAAVLGLGVTRFKRR